MFRIAPDISASLFSCLGAILFGMTIGYSSPALSNSDFKEIINGDNITWFGSLVAIGAIMGGVFGSILRHYFGVKVTLLLTNIPFSIGWILIIVRVNVGLIMVGRILTGLMVGVSSLSIPSYVADIAENSRRGILGCCFQLSVTIGILIIYSVGMFIHWNYLAILVICVSGVYVVCLLFIPESPTWLVSKNRSPEAQKSLVWLLQSEERATEKLKILEDTKAKENHNIPLFKELKHPANLKPLLIAVGLMIFQQASGINGILFYSAITFEEAGFKDNPEAPTIIIGVILVVATIIACFFIDRAGRRVLLLISGSFMTISMIAFGVYYFLVERTSAKASDLAWLSLGSVSLFIFTFSIGWSSIPWLGAAELIPPNIKNFGLMVTTVVNWLSVFVSTKGLHYIVTHLTDYGGMWMFASICFLGVLFVFFFLPETKGKSLEEIRSHFSSGYTNFD